MNFSRITDTLLVGTTPTTEDYDILRAQGVRLVINMRAERRPYPDRHNPPILRLWLPTVDFPLVPIPIFLLKRGARAALDVLTTGGKVYTHCAGGVHRSVAMAAAILIAQGYPVADATQLIKRRREIADPDAWYIRRQIKRFAAAWENYQ